MCKDCGQKYYKTSKEVFKNYKGKGPECPHCFLLYQRHPKNWRKKVKEIRADIKNNPHKKHKVRVSKYDSNYLWCFDCHELIPVPEQLPYVHTESSAGPGGYYVSTTSSLQQMASSNYCGTTGAYS